MARKWKLVTWGIYSLGCFLLMIIGFNWKVSIPISVIIGYFCGLINEIFRQLLFIRGEITKSNKQVGE